MTEYLSESNKFQSTAVEIRLIFVNKKHPSFSNTFLAIFQVSNHDISLWLNH